MSSAAQKLKQSREAGYSDDEILDFLSKSDEYGPKLQASREGGYSDEEILDFLGQKEPEAERGPIEGAFRKAGRELGQLAIGRVEQATLPYNLVAIGAGKFEKATREINYRQTLQDQLEELSDKKLRGQWDERDEEILQSTITQLNDPELAKQNLPEEELHFDVGSLIEKGFEQAGIDMRPEDISEQAMRWTGWIKNPKNIMNLTDITKNAKSFPALIKDISKSVLPSGTEAGRGIGAAMGLEIAADNELGPIGSLAAGIAGDLMAGGVMGAAKAGGKLVMNPSKTIKEWTAKGAKYFTPKDKLDLQKKIIQDFRNAGIQPDIGTITDSSIMKGIQAKLAQSQFTGKPLQEFKEQMVGQIEGRYKEVANSVGEAKFGNLQDAGEALVKATQDIREADAAVHRNIYEKVDKIAESPDALVLPRDLGQKVKALEKKLTPGGLKGTEQKAVLKYLEDLKTDMFDDAGNIKSARVQDLVNSKKALNDIIDFEVQGGTKQLLKGIAHDLDNAIKEYGEINADFKKNYAAANAKFAEHAKTFRNRDVLAIAKGENPMLIMNKMNSPAGIRKIGAVLNKTAEGRQLFKDLKRFKMDEILQKNMVDGVSQQFKLGTFTNVLKKGKNREIIRELMSPAAFKRLESLQKMTGRLAESAQAFMNASKSGVHAVDMLASAKLISDFGNLFAGNVWPLMKSGGVYLASKRLSKLFGDPEFLKMVEDSVLASGKRNMPRMQKIASAMRERFLPEEGQKGPTTALRRSPQVSPGGGGPQSPASSSQASAVKPPEPSSSALNRVPSSKTPSKTGLPAESVGTIDPSNKKMIYQGSNDPKLLLNKAAIYKKDFIDDVHSLIEGIKGASLKGARAKTPESVDLKLARGYKPDQIPDYLGARIMVNSKSALDKVMKRLEAKKPIELENYIVAPKGEWGYRAVHTQLPIDGMSGELQIVPEIIGKLQPWMHKYYKKWQQIPLEIKMKDPEYLSDVNKVSVTVKKSFEKFEKS